MMQKREAPDLENHRVQRDIRLDPLPVSEVERHRILVAEDNPANQAVLRMQLDVLGCEADQAADGVEALAKWRAGKHDLILADRNMPNMDGLELARFIRSLEKNGATHVPIIAITADHHREEITRCRAAGMDDALPKPIALDDLRGMLERWLPRASSEAGASNDHGSGSPVREQAIALDLEQLARITGDSDVRQASALIDLFIRTARADLPVCHRYLSEKNGRSLAQYMHKLKSSARMVGALRFADLAVTLEDAAKSKRFAATKSLMVELESALGDVAVAVNRINSSAGGEAE
ncbi:MAG: response regulator [Nitrosomonadales bacterium]|nr:response regulator [Nitrosomonadales bacterium]